MEPFSSSEASIFDVLRNLALFDLNIETTDSTNATSYGLGAVLLQTRPTNGERRAVAYMSRLMIYTHIEKKTLTVKGTPTT